MNQNQLKLKLQCRSLIDHRVVVFLRNGGKINVIFVQVPKPPKDPEISLQDEWRQHTSYSSPKCHSTFCHLVWGTKRTNPCAKMLILKMGRINSFSILSLNTRCIKPILLISNCVPYVSFYNQYNSMNK